MAAWLFGALSLTLALWVAWLVTQWTELEHALAVARADADYWRAIARAYEREAGGP